MWNTPWRHQAITWTSIDLSSIRSSDIHLSAILQKIPQPPTIKISLSQILSNLPGAHELMLCLQITVTPTKQLNPPWSLSALGHQYMVANNFPSALLDYCNSLPIMIYAICINMPTPWRGHVQQPNLKMDMDVCIMNEFSHLK